MEANNGKEKRENLCKSIKDNLKKDGNNSKRMNNILLLTPNSLSKLLHTLNRESEILKHNFRTEDLQKMSIFTRLMLDTRKLDLGF